MFKRFVVLAVIAGSVFYRVSAIEGMWMLFLDSARILDMQERGLMLEAGDIYSESSPSLKDAVIMFGGGCTGAVISDQGLIITNHHCGFSDVQRLSTLENNLLENGFRAGSMEEELPSEGATVTFLRKMENVTERVLAGVSDEMDEETRNRTVASNAANIINNTVRGTGYKAEINPFSFGREYYMFVYETFSDVRLVVAPPMAIGNFGGDTDNWIWPRHTGDFTMFRIYADENNQPAAFSSDNKPYRPVNHFTIATEGVEEGDFTMVIGYPGLTEEYLFSDEIRMLYETVLPAKVGMRTLKLSVLDDIMKNDPAAELRYSSRYKTISNAWKKWIGVINGFERTETVKSKLEYEKSFDNWAIATAEGEEYRGLMGGFRDFYRGFAPLYNAADISAELLNNIETFRLMNRTVSLLNSWAENEGISDSEGAGQVIESIRSFYNTNPVESDRIILPGFLEIYESNVSATLLPQFYRTISSRFNGNYDAFTADLYKSGIFTDTSLLFKTIGKGPQNALRKVTADPYYKLYLDFQRTLAEKVNLELYGLLPQQDRLYRKYTEGMMKMDSAGIFYHDANSTMRLTYGKVEGYRPSDAVEYSYYTTLSGVIEKEDPEIEDYQVPQKLKELYITGDTGSYTVDGDVPVCFTASNHTSGGNSGSPVINARGELIGINFDRNWEGTMSDYDYNPDICRNISLDIRYVLFLLEKYLGADNIINELNLAH